MRSILTVAEVSEDDSITTLDRIKAELSITGTDKNRDLVLQAKIDEASNDIEAALGFRVALETVIETFWHEGGDSAPEYLVLNRTPVASTPVPVVVMDDVTLDASTYRIDQTTGQIYALCNGYPYVWQFCKSLIITYAGGYVMPAEGDDSTLPPGIQGACIDLVSSFWAAKGRDPSVRAEEIPGVISKQYWVGAVGEEGELPPSVVSKLALFRRANVA